MVLEHSLARPDFNTFGCGGILIKNAVSGSCPKYVENSLAKLCAEGKEVEWHNSLCTVLRALAPTEHLTTFIRKIKGCPIRDEALFHIARGSPEYKKYAEGKQVESALIARYMGYPEIAID